MQQLFTGRRASRLAVAVVLCGCLLSSSPYLGAESLALVGGTVIDVADWGRSTADIEDAVVLVRDDVIVAVGPRAEVEISADASRLDISGLFVVPGLTDGFAAINNQKLRQRLSLQRCPLL